MSDSFAEFDQRLDGLRSQASEAQSKYRAARNDIQRDALLSDEGRQEQIDIARRHIQANLDQLKVAEDKAIRDKVQQLERSVFGYTTSSNPNDIISRRDADDRAERLKSEQEALDLLERAERAGDTHLAQAIARVAAYKSGYTKVIAAYDREHPGARGKLDFLAQIQQGTSSTNYKMTRAMAYGLSGS